jgi:hypothetical protein
MSGAARQQGGQAPSGYLPPGTVPIVFDGFEGLNTKSPRAGIEDQQCSWMDGFIPLGKNNARTLPDVGASVFSDPNLIVWFDFFNIGSTPYALVMKTDGSLVAVNTSTSSSSVIAGAGTVQNPAVGNIGLTQWGNKYVEIVANQTNGYFVWDSTTFYAPGASVPGQGTVPSGVGGTAAETYQGRVWISNGNETTFSAPDSFTDFSTGDGGGTFLSTDSFLRVQYTRPKQINGFLYNIGDSSINYISGVQTTGSPPTTTFSNLNADAENGTPWADSVEIFGASIAFANAWGAHMSFGGAVQKISEPVDVLWNSLANFGGGRISTAKAIIFGVRVLMYLVPVIDTFTGQQTNKLIMTNGKQWWTSQQSKSLIFIATQEINSVQTAWGTDGSSLFPLFQTPGTGFAKTIQSKLFATPESIMTTKAASLCWALCQIYQSAGAGFTLTIDSENGNSQQVVEATPGNVTWTNSDSAVANWTNSGSATATWTGTGQLTGIYVTPPIAVSNWGALIGTTIQTSAADMSLIAVVIGAEEQTYRG